ncbi:MAG: hypothetical protein HY698_08665 [Deltaproteobacteria bacterium]|nr:hypothetical protein [Deltaproteobacteria bacterium]
MTHGRKIVRLALLVTLGLATLALFLWLGDSEENLRSTTGPADQAGTSVSSTLDKSRVLQVPSPRRVAGVDPLLDQFLRSMETLNDAEIERHLQELRLRGDEIVARLGERYRGSSPSELQLRWRLAMTASELRDERALGLLSEILDTETKLALANVDPQPGPGHGVEPNRERVVIMLGAIDGIASLAENAVPRARDVLFRTVLGHPYAGVKRVAAMAFIRTSSDEGFARKELADALPAADKELANVTERRGTEF